MIGFVLMAFAAGLLIGLSRQLNGRLSLSTSAMESSLWNHVVGAAFLTLVAVVVSGLFQGDLENIPLWAYLGGPIGVIFIAASSWLITQIGAVSTTMLIIAGQMIFGILFDILRDVPGDLTVRMLGTVLILSGMWLLQKPIKDDP